MSSKSAYACPFALKRPGTESVTDLVKDVLLVAIGFGVLGFQKAQVRRRELADAVDRFRQRLSPDAA